MPVIEFALDTASQYRVQVHLNTHQSPVSVMLNHRVLGSLVTVEEQHAGKDFRLPDASLLRVRINDGHAQAWRNGQSLLLIPSSNVSRPLEPQKRHMSSGPMTLLLLNMLAFGTLIAWFGLEAYVVTPASRLFFPLLAFGVIGILGLIGLLTLLTWKRWGLYLAGCYVIANIAMAIFYGQVDYRTFIPLIGLILLYLTLRSSGLWRAMH